MEYVVLGFRTLVVYLVIVIIFRLMGKREVGELSLLDLVIFIMIAELASMSIENAEMPFFDAILPMIILMIVQISLAAISIRSRRFRKIIDGEAVIIVNKGKIDEKMMRKQRYNLDDLLLQLREQQIGDVRDVEYAILEASGNLSVFVKNHQSSMFVYPLILDGAVQEVYLERIGRTNLWLRQQLKELGYTDLKRISYCSYRNGEFFVDMKE
ncbi:DUF421 domain-containing protein [Priestia taiwanensis]|uniref:DUF421 domain-containing protein n=1 Tax=Priestia taiwanensis TaxID=1347902 RepID=A0A917AU06_9BACI|nr:DUF421 domain-containing protein [Priestia taiwanensis]MBM7363641.1 uncharacterized membrane protein YcaP (DUF421 family) [Priestia taiwanensis]GGE75359.1 DUF421 domain-containing protein [Priestia taiwanensis]